MENLTLGLMLIMMAGGAVVNADSATNQIVEFKERKLWPVGVLSTSSGMKIDNNTANSSLQGKLVLNDFFMDTMTHFVRERIPERVVHGKGAGAFGYFQVTHDISDICKAKLFSIVGKKTQIAVRFSLLIAQSGGSDLLRDNRGFAVKFYTEDGNYDIAGIATPNFPFKDPLLTHYFVHSLKRNPATNLPDPNTVWDAITLHPESLNTFLLLNGDIGIPYGYRFMPGFGVHTFQVVNKHGVSHFVRFHFIPDGGIKTLRSEDALSLGATDPDFAIRDLYNAIETGNYPSWTVGVQVLSMDDVKNAAFDVFDPSKSLPLKKYPIRPFGRLVLNRNPRNTFAEIEQLAFNPGNLVPGVLGSPDKLYEARVLAYRDANNYRLGANFNRIKVNKPINKPFTNNRDGVAPVDDNEWDTPNYYPCSFHGAQPYIEKNKVDLIEINEEPTDNMYEMRELYTNEFTDDERTRLIQNIVSTLGLATKVLQEKAVGIFNQIHCDFGRRVQEALQNMNTTTSDIYPLVKNVL